MKNSYPSKQSRRHAKRKSYFKKYRATRQPSKQDVKQISKQGGSDDYHTV
ncbi:hypothetical protein [Psychrobacter sp.]